MKLGVIEEILKVRKKDNRKDENEKERRNSSEECEEMDNDMEWIKKKKDRKKEYERED